ncbi:hypothetical protein TNCV_1076111 [Trichonephila clavipes]|nr:hypothetical protein TNCV_1076111 [Trichonephila clavipes]
MYANECGNNVLCTSDSEGDFRLRRHGSLLDILVGSLISGDSNMTWDLLPALPAESSDSEIEDEDVDKSNPTAVGTPQNRIPPIFVNPLDNWCTLIFIARQLAPTLISKLNGAGPHEAKNWNRAFEDPLICANFGGEHAANWRQCPRFPKTKNNKKAPQKGNQNKNQHPKGNNPNNLPQNKIQERNLGSRNDLNLKSSMHAQSKIQQPQSNYRAVIPSVSYSKVVSGQIRENRSC